MGHIFVVGEILVCAVLLALIYTLFERNKKKHTWVELNTLLFDDHMLRLCKHCLMS